MNYLLIENQGVIDTEALTLIGASTKRDNQSKFIGFYGSGNKYAIPTLIRLGIPFKIFAGEREIVIETEDIEFRGMAFSKIIIDGHHTSLTTSMGPQWEEWMAIREWVSNSIDEGGSNIISSTPIVEGRDGYTRFYVQHTPEISKLIEDWDLLFTFDRTDAVYNSVNGKIFPKNRKAAPGILLFRKGIKVYGGDDQISLYQYDLETFNINESRVVESLYSAGCNVVRYLCSVTDVKIISNILKKLSTKDSTYWEKYLEWKYTGATCSDAWYEAIKDRALIIDTVSEYFEDIIKSKKHYLISVSMAAMLHRSFGDSIKIYGYTDSGDILAFKNVAPTIKIETLLKDSVDFLTKVNYDIKYPIEIVSFERKCVLGLAHNNTILLSDKLFDQGKKEIVSTIIEENEHLRTGYTDYSREFQSHFINLFLSEKEERYNSYL